MAYVVEHCSVREPGSLETITRENIWSYLLWDNAAKILTTRIIDPFKETAVARTGFTAKNPPSGAQTTSIPIDKDILFVVVSESSERPPYKEVVDRLEGFVDFLQEQYRSSISRKGVMTIDENPC